MMNIRKKVEFKSFLRLRFFTLLKCKQKLPRANVVGLRHRIILVGKVIVVFLDIVI